MSNSKQKPKGAAEVAKTTTRANKPPTSIIGVGASAGGLMAIRKFIAELKHLPDAAVVIIQHLSLEHQSLMDQLIKGYTDIPVKFAEPGPIEANTIYLNIGNFNIIVKDGQFVKVDRQKTDDNYYFPINLFFNSIAHEFGAHAAVIILTGTGTDGSVGIVAVKEFGGIVMVQDPSHAEFNGMPEAAMSHSVHDFVLSPSELGKQVQKMYSSDLIKIKTDQAHAEAKQENSEELFDRYVRLILLEIKRRLGMNFLSYKNSTIHRRIIKHIFTTESSDVASYYDKILHDTDELKNLAQGFLIRVTRFYRDASVWESIARDIIPELLKRGNNKQLRIFSAACSTGDEAYTMAMLLQDAAEKNNQVLDVKIFATDLDEEALGIANAGVYSMSSLEELPQHYIDKYFTEVDEGQYQVSEKLRSKILFAKHDLIKDPPFIKLDLVICRNLFIYLNQQEQTSLLNKFHFGLKEDSFLVLGRTESISTSSKELFVPLDENNRTFKNRVSVMRKFRVTTSSDDSTSVESDIVPSTKHRALQQTQNKAIQFKNMKSSLHFGESSQLFMHYSELILGRIAKPSIIITEDMDVLFMFGPLGDILKLPQGIPNSSVSSTIKDSLVPICKDGVSTALSSNKPVQYDSISVPESENDLISLTFIPERSDLLYAPVVLMVVDSAVPSEIAENVQKISSDEVDKRKIAVLENELQKIKLTLQSTVEELETTNEELQASNEELLAANEELQSSNEELQSVNEELYSVNTEMQEKMVELGNLHSDIDSMIQSTDLGVLFLDADLKVRKITPKAMEQFNFTKADEGRSIGDFTKNFKLDTLMDDINKCRSEVKTIEHEIHNDKLDGDFILRISPYRRNVMNRQVIEGAVLAFIELTPSIRNSQNK